MYETIDYDFVEQVANPLGFFCDVFYHKIKCFTMPFTVRFRFWGVVDTKEDGDEVIAIHEFYF